MHQIAILAFPRRPEDRLRLALRRLDEALAGQREAVRAWRGELGGLAHATVALNDSLGSFQDALDEVAKDARHADAEARRLTRTIDLWDSMSRGA